MSPDLVYHEVVVANESASIKLLPTRRIFMPTGYLELDDGKLYYEVSRTQPDQQTLVLSHAGFLDSRMWDHQWAAFAEHYRVVRYDMRGYGKSDPVSGPRTRRHDLLRLLHHLDITNAHLLGCSVGGEIVLDLALEHPHLAASLIIVNGTPSGFQFQGAPPPEMLDMITATQQGNFDLASELQLRIWVDGPQRQPDQVDPQVRRQASAMNRPFVASGTWALADLQPHAPLAPPAVDRLREIQAPTLIISGPLDYAETLRAAELMAGAIPNARHVLIPGTAHVPNLEQPAHFNQVVIDFLSTQ
jgi:pimeloyl-ACP methyl ester carboxylesterase